jgi:hypothetical protein
MNMNCTSCDAHIEATHVAVACPGCGTALLRCVRPDFAVNSVMLEAQADLDATSPRHHRRLFLAGAAQSGAPWVPGS